MECKQLENELRASKQAKQAPTEEKVEKPEEGSEDKVHCDINTRSSTCICPGLHSTTAVSSPEFYECLAYSVINILKSKEKTKMESH